MSETVFAPTDLPAGLRGVSTAVLDGEVVLYNEQSRLVHRLNALTGSVWLLSDGTTSVGSIADELAELFTIDANELTEGVQQSLQLLADNGLLVGHERPRQMIFEPAEQFASDGSRVLPRPTDP